MRALVLVALALVAGCSPCLGPRTCLTGSAPVAEAALSGWTSSPAVERIPSYNFDDIVETMRLSYIAYDSTGDSTNALGGARRIDVDTIRLNKGGPSMVRFLTGVRALVWRNAANHRVYVAIRGTDNLGNVILDALYPKDPDPVLGVHVHRGAKSLVDRLYDPVCDSVAAMLQSGDTVWVTGHSLGGAGATLMYLRFYEQKRFPLGPLYTFAAMRVLNEDAVRKYRCLVPCIRVVNWNDPAPHLPPSRKTCRNSWDPGCDGRFAQLGDELVIVDTISACFYATDQHQKVSMASSIMRFVQGLLADAVLDSVDLRRFLLDLQMHVPQLYYDKVRAYQRAGAKPCTFCCHPRENRLRCGCPAP